jgi:nucleoside-diphosphate-sugar epimerase
MRVVITGATGNVGSRVLAALEADERVTSVVAVARRPPRPPDDEAPKTSWVAADVAVDDLTATFQGAAALVHLAWTFHPTRHEVQTWRVNVLGTLRTVDAALAAGVRTVLYASSVGAYSPAASTAPVDERWPTHALPTAAYGRQKSYLERAFDALEPRHPETRFVRLRSSFVFQRPAAAEQRRIFAGPFVAGWLLRPGLIPRLPLPRGLRLQAVHASDLAEAYRLALHCPVSGPFNVAADPVLDADALAALLGTKRLTVGPRVVRAALATAWHARLVPTEPGLLELALSLPVMDTTRARTELGWRPAVSAGDAVAELLDGVRAASGGPTPTLDRHAGGPLRIGELATGVGARA